MKFLVLGSINLDMTFSVDHIVKKGETESSTGLTINAGGKGANQAASLAKAGSIVYFAGKLGEDGKWVLDTLSSFGADTTLSIIGKDERTGEAIIQLDKSGENCILLFPGGNRKFEEEEVKEIISHFDEGDYILMQNEINLLPVAFKEAKKKGMKIAFNPSPYEKILMDLPLEDVSLFFVNEVEAKEMSGYGKDAKGEEDFIAMGKILSSKYPDAIVVLTAGKHGAYAFEKAEYAYSPIVDYPVEDTTGAGDTFSGYFLKALTSGSSLKEALDISSIASGLAVSRKGAMGAMPYWSEVMDVYQKSI